MYIPAINKMEDREEIVAFINRYNFATVISTGADGPLASHIPIESDLRADELYLTGHVAKANNQWHTFQEDQSILLSFMESHSYISPSWYDYAEVPTWNYIAVHAYGKPRIFEGEELLTFVSYQMNKYEASSKQPVRPEHLDSKYLQRQLRSIVGFEIKVDDLQARYKLSQNKSDANFQSVVRHLEEQASENAQKIAAAMKNLKKY